MKYQKNISDSKSLWNYTLSPGWTIEEVEVLKVALMKFGVGKWKSIMRSNCLPGKTIAQMNLQTQRLLGQQSLAEFMGLNVNLESVFRDNALKMGPGIIRKNNFIINTGDNLTLEDRKKKIKLNYKKYGLLAEQRRKLKIPRLLAQNIGHYLTIKQIKDDKNNFSIIEKIEKLKNLIKCMKKKLQIIETVESRKINTNAFSEDDKDSSSEKFNIILKKSAEETFELVD